MAYSPHHLRFPLLAGDDATFTGKQESMASSIN